MAGVGQCYNRKMKEVQALLLDIDGTILDTREFIFQAAEFALATNRYPPVPRPQIAKAVGHSFDDFYGVVLGKEVSDPLPLQEAHRLFQLEHVNLSQPFPGAKETLMELKRRGYLLAAVTSRARISLIPTLDAALLTSLFDEIIASDDVSELKPSAVPLLLALDRMNISPSKAVMVGDTDLDIEAGKRAGTATIRVWYGFMGPHDEKVKADLYIEKDIKELLELFP